MLMTNFTKGKKITKKGLMKIGTPMKGNSSKSIFKLKSNGSKISKNRSRRMDSLDISHVSSNFQTKRKSKNVHYQTINYKDENLQKLLKKKTFTKRPNE
mmetsp:Transcript_27749/g.24540  ORF Transcript_27749/g.24540 Transcript_27749/m.24540 type:complete len:99 (+) Transcript_27749:366-662(+)